MCFKRVRGPFDGRFSIPCSLRAKSLSSHTNNGDLYYLTPDLLLPSSRSCNIRVLLPPRRTSPLSVALCSRSPDPTVSDNRGHQGLGAREKFADFSDTGREACWPLPGRPLRQFDHIPSLSQPSQQVSRRLFGTNDSFPSHMGREQELRHVSAIAGKA